MARGMQADEKCLKNNLIFFFFFFFHLFWSLMSFGAVRNAESAIR